MIARASPMATAPQTSAASPIDRHAAPTADTKSNSGKATAALILGIVIVLICWFPIVPFITGAIGVALGYTARGEIKKRGLNGLALANTGIALSIVGAVLWVVLVAIGLMAQ
jgi:Domain of unknown function (DUF4190)